MVLFPITVRAAPILAVRSISDTDLYSSTTAEPSEILFLDDMQSQTRYFPLLKLRQLWVHRVKNPIKSTLVHFWSNWIQMSHGLCHWVLSDCCHIHCHVGVHVRVHRDLGYSGMLWCCKKFGVVGTCRGYRRRWLGAGYCYIVVVVVRGVAAVVLVLVVVGKTDWRGWWLMVQISISGIGILLSPNWCLFGPS